MDSRIDNWFDSFEDENGGIWSVITNNTIVAQIEEFKRGIIGNENPVDVKESALKLKALKLKTRAGSACSTRRSRTSAASLK